MAQTKLSKIAWTFAGEYVSGRAYEQLSIVNYEGNAYLSKADGVTAIPTNSSFWVQISRNMNWDDMTETQKKEIADSISVTIGVSLAEMQEKVEAIAGSASQSQFVGIHTAVASLPTDLTIPAWGLVGSSLTALSAYTFNPTTHSWTLLTSNVYDFTDYSGVKAQVSELASKLGDFEIDEDTNILTYNGKRYMLIGIEEESPLYTGAICGRAICGQAICGTE